MSTRSKATHYWPLGPVDLFVGKKIRALRKESSTRVTKLALASELSPAKIYRIEKGKRHLQPRELLLIACFFQIAPIRLFDGFEEEKPITSDHQSTEIFEAKIENNLSGEIFLLRIPKMDPTCQNNNADGVKKTRT